jgi:hypothetical protein
MELPVVEVQEQRASTPGGNVRERTASSGAPLASAVSPQACSTCGAVPGANGGAAPASWVYAIGRIEPRFPNISIEKEFAQATGRQKPLGTDSEALRAVLSKAENRYWCGSSVG